MQTHVWTQHRESGGYWRCPVAVLEEMRAKGWELSDAPPEQDLTTAERRAWRTERAAAASVESKPTKAARRGATEE